MKPEVAREAAYLVKEIENLTVAIRLWQDSEPLGPEGLPEALGAMHGITPISFGYGIADWESCRNRTITLLNDRREVAKKRLAEL
jgi:hypothetical protein